MGTEFPFRVKYSAFGRRADFFDKLKAASFGRGLQPWDAQFSCPLSLLPQLTQKQSDGRTFAPHWVQNRSSAEG